MAKIEIFFETVENINLTASVGRNAVNLKDDVLVVQAMLKYALKDRSYFRDFKFPEPTGSINEETKILIREYQRYLRRKEKQDVALDGVMNRAVGVTPAGRRDYWTILSLNTHALQMRLLKGGLGNHIEDLCRQFPQLLPVVGDFPVGSLSLTLESAASRIGTLNLGLE